jgi:hypothetical protein
MEVSHMRKETEQETKQEEVPNENEYPAIKDINNAWVMTDERGL